MSVKRWKCLPVLLMVLAACRVASTSAAAVTDDATLKLTGGAPDNENVTKIHGERNLHLDNPDSHTHFENESDDSRALEIIGNALSLEEKITGVNDAERSASYSDEKPVFQNPPFVFSALHISGREGKLRNILTKKRKTSSAKFKSKIKNKPSDLTSKDARIPGVSKASGASIDGHGANGLRLAPSDASYQRQATAGHADAAHANSDPELSASVSSVLPVPTDRQIQIHNVPRASLDYEVASQNVLSLPSGNEMPSASMSSVVPGPEVSNDREQRERDSFGKAAARAELTSKRGKIKLTAPKSSVVSGKDGALNDFSERDIYDSFVVKSDLSRVTDASDLESYSPVLGSAAISSDRFSDSNVKVHLKEESLIEDALAVNDDKSESDAEVKSNIVKRSTSDSPGIEENPSNFLDQEGPTGHVVQRGIMENFAGDFTSPVDFQFSDDYFNHEPYHYDIYYDDSMNSDFPNEEEDFDVVDIEQPGSTSDASAQSFPWEDGIADNDATEDVDDGLEDVENTLELRLLGPDFQSELGYVLERLANDSQQRSRRHQVPVRHHDPRYSEGISVGVAEGTCPPAVHSLPPGLCQAPPCTSHMMCYPQKMCCFNGCTYTCTEPVQPPPVVDWLEDSDIRLPILDPLNPSLPLRFESSPLSYGTGGEETVRLPGGCSLSATKYEELKQFMTAESIQDCLCSGGEVVCVVKSSPSD